VPVAAPSANISGRPSPTACQHVLDDLKGRIEYIIDGGPCRIGVESTVLDITSGTPVILRPGGVTREMLEKVIGEVKTDTVLKPEDGLKPRSPGMKYRHYSPKARMLLLEGKTEDVIEKINSLACENRANGLKTGVLASRENKNRYAADVVLSIGSHDNPEEVASRLYDFLRRFDEEKVDIIYSETFSEEGMGMAVMNRLKKAASGRIEVKERR
ncbi:MAG TPA: threonylcarbamoyl-AMP synthase, partial [Clostridiaceae bacterium]|nr:threonylcarbamoyl-AMP synthase [Clostridiaceae bacterium]